MDALVFFPENEDQLNKLIALANDTKINVARLNEDEKKRVAGVLLANLASKNPNAYATDAEIISVVEEARQERYGKRD